MLNKKYYLIIGIFLLFITCERDEEVIINNQSFYKKTYHFSGKVLDCLTKNPIAGANVDIEHTWGSYSDNIWQPGPNYSFTDHTYCKTDSGGQFSASVTVQQNGSFKFHAGAANYWSPYYYCGCKGASIDGSQILFNKISPDSILFELLPFSPEIKRPVKLFYKLKNGSWPDYGMTYSFYMQDNYSEWRWIYRDSLIISDGYLLCNYILGAEGMHKDNSTSFGYTSGCRLYDTLRLPFDLKDIPTIETDTIQYAIEFDCLKDTLIFSILNSKNQ